MRTPPDHQKIARVGAVPTLGLWRMTRGLYRFDSTVLEALAETRLDHVPTDVLRRLPEHAPYFDMSGHAWSGEEVEEGRKLLGAWFAVFPSDRGHPVLEVTGVYEGDWIMPYRLYLTRDTLTGCLQDTITSIQEAHRAVRTFREEQGLGSLPDAWEDGPTLTLHQVQLTHLVLNLALYLCSDEPDISGVVKTPQPHSQKRYGHMSVAPQRDNVLEVGARVGGAIRGWREGARPPSHEGTGTGSAKAPHIRRAHWAVRWTGPGKEVARLVWLAPTAVGVRNLDTLPVHVRAVPDRPGREESA